MNLYNFYFMKNDNAKTRQQIADEYGVSRKTFYNWLKEASIKLKRRLITPTEQKVIYDEFGHPKKT